MVESGLQSKTNISNVGMVDIGPMIILLLVALEMGLEVNFYHVLGTEELVAVETTLEESMIDTWMTDMMAGVMEIKTVITAESKFGGHDSIIVNDRYQPGGDRIANDRYGGSDCYPQNGYGRDRG